MVASKRMRPRYEATALLRLLSSRYVIGDSGTGKSHLLVALAPRRPGFAPPSSTALPTTATSSKPAPAALAHAPAIQDHGSLSPRENATNRLRASLADAELVRLCFG